MPVPVSGVNPSESPEIQIESSRNTRLFLSDTRITAQGLFQAQLPHLGLAFKSFLGCKINSPRCYPKPRSGISFVGRSGLRNRILCLLWKLEAAKRGKRIKFPGSPFAPGSLFVRQPWDVMDTLFWVFFFVGNVVFLVCLGNKTVLKSPGFAFSGIVSPPWCPVPDFRENHHHLTLENPLSILKSAFYETKGLEI